MTVDTENATALSTALIVVVVLFPLSEIVLTVAKRATSTAARVDDRGSLRVFWLAIGLGVALASVTQSLRLAPLPGPTAILQLLALLFIVGGMSIRWAAIVTLGRFFTVNVATHARQPVVQSGVFRFIRHPSYAGLLLSFVGLGIFFADWLSLVVLLIPITAAVMNRIVKEEAVMLASLGTPYGDYCARTKRLIPGIL
jgi:protein-S-isoprenylcysteine O-methyltransferase Ste14